MREYLLVITSISPFNWIPLLKAKHSEDHKVGQHKYYRHNADGHPQPFHVLQVSVTIGL
jgi:hypothetical protein